MGDHIPLRIFQGKAPVILRKAVLAGDIINFYILRDVPGGPELRLGGGIVHVAAAAPEYHRLAGGNFKRLRAVVQGSYGELFHFVGPVVIIFVPERIAPVRAEGNRCLRGIADLHKFHMVAAVAVDVLPVDVVGVNFRQVQPTLLGILPFGPRFHLGSGGREQK